MPEDKIRSRLILALEEGDRKTARRILRQLLKEDEDKLEYWLWLSTVVHSRQESISCLKKVLDLEPGHPAAVQGLIILGEESPGEVKAQPIPQVDWLREIDDISPPEEKSFWFGDLMSGKRIPFAVGVGVIVLGLVLSGVFFPGRGSLFSPKLTITPITWTPSQETGPQGLIGTPDPKTLTPIGRVLESTYTPTPLYVRTPHGNYSTYNTALEAYRRGDYQTMLTYLQTTVDMIETPDIVYLIGEAHRNLGQYQQALDAYERAIFLDENFAPAYYGRALVLKELDPESDILADLDRAVQLDPAYGAVYLEKAAYYLEQGDLESLLENAQQAVRHLPESPQAHYYRALAFLESGQIEKAYRDGDIALEGDINHVPTYRLMGRIYLALGEPSAAISMLSRYGKYAGEKTAEYYYDLGKAYFQTENYQEADQYLTTALGLGRKTADVYLMRGLSLVETGKHARGFDNLYRAWKIDPENYSILFAMGEAYFRTSNFYRAISAFNLAEGRTSQQDQLARIFYWRAQAYRATGQQAAAQRDWQALLDLSGEDVPEAWLETARQELLPTVTPTITQTPTPSTTPSPIVSSTPTPVPTLMATPAGTTTP